MTSGLRGRGSLTISHITEIQAQRTKSTGPCLNSAISEAARSPDYFTGCNFHSDCSMEIRVGSAPPNEERAEPPG